MTVADVVAKTMDGRLEDFVREAVALVAREVMDAQISSEIGAELGEVAPDVRSTHRNGYRQRAWETRVGRSSCRSRRSGRGARISRAFWSPDAVRSRRLSRSCWRPT
jgi:transposase-like protein